MLPTQYKLEKHLRSKDTGLKFSILIPTWNNLAYLKKCIESIRKHSTYPHQLLVHINEGKDNTLDWVKSQADIDYCFSEINIGVCYALNYLRTIATTDYIVYLNDDMYVCPGWDGLLVEEINKMKDPFFFFSSTLIEPQASSNCAIERDYGTDLASFDENKLLHEFAGLTKADWSGATWPPNIVHKEIWDLVGGYSIEFSPGMYSDPDFTMKLWSIGVRVFKGIGASRVYHFRNKSTDRVKHNKGYYPFIRKWGFTYSWLNKFRIHRGEPYTGPLAESGLSRGQKVKMLYKKILAAFSKN